MNKNPFLPAPSFTPQQPPLPPGPPPPQPGQADYSGWWNGTNAHAPHVQPPTVGPYTPQWGPSQPPRPPAEQSALYANYGYGTQNNHWQRQQQQQQQIQQYHPPPQLMQQQPPPAQPAYNPYQPTAGYAQPYVPQPGPPPQPIVQVGYPHAPAQPQHIFVQPMGSQQPQHQQHQPHQPRHHHNSPQHLPPAKRQRFDGPNNNSRHHQGQQHHQQPPQPQFQPPPAPPQNPANFPASNRNGPPSGPGGRGGGPSGPGGRTGMTGARGGRGGSMSGNRGGLGGGRGRAGSFVGGSASMRGGGPGTNAPLRGQHSRNNFNSGGKDFNRRGGGNSGSFNAGAGSGGYHQGTASFRGRNQGQSGANRGRGDQGNSSFASRDGAQSSNFGGKKDENRRTLTDFKIVGLSISELGWTWGAIPSSVVKLEDGTSDVDNVGLPNTSIKQEVKEESAEDTLLPPATAPQGSEIKEEVKDENVPVPSNDIDMAEASTAAESLPSAHVSTETHTSQPPPSRIRIYFHTPVTADDSRPIPHNASYGDVPTDTRKGKRKKLEDDDGDVDERRGPPPPPQMASAAADDRSSVDPSVDPSVAETASEADWLMAAIVEGEEEEADAADALHMQDEDEHISHLNSDVKEPEHGPSSNLDETQNGGAVDHGGKQRPAVFDVPSVKAPLHHVESAGLSPRAHTADFFPFLKGTVHDVDATEHIEFNISGSSAVVGSDVGDSTQLGEGPIGSPGLVAASLDPVPAGPVSNSDSHASMGDPEQSTVGTEPVVASEATVPDSIVSNVLSSPQSDFHGHNAANHPADDQPSDTYIPTEPQPDSQPKSLQVVAMEPTLLNIESQDTVLNEDSQMSQFVEPEHLPEPPASPLSNTLPSTTSSPHGEVVIPTAPKADLKVGKSPSANRLSISYSSGNRRLVMDAEVVESLKLFRKEGRIEILVNVAKEKDETLRGILVEALSEVTKSYLPLPPASNTPLESDCTVPPFWNLTPPASIQLIVYLDTARPLSEPKWAKTGDVQDWLKSMFGRMFWVAGDAAEGWEKKIQVVDPDPPPTIWTVLEGWSMNSPVGTPTERQRFLKTHLTEVDNMLEILLRLVRGERATAFSQSTPTISAPSVSGPLLAALQGSAHGAQQTHVSLAVLALFRLTQDYAEKTMGDKAKTDVEEHVGEIIRCLPSHLVYKSLDGIFKEWRVDKKGR